MISFISKAIILKKKPRRPAYKCIQSKAKGQKDRGQEAKKQNSPVQTLHNRILSKEQCETVE